MVAFQTEDLFFLFWDHPLRKNIGPPANFRLPLPKISVWLRTWFRAKYGGISLLPREEDSGLIAQLIKKTHLFVLYVLYSAQALAIQFWIKEFATLHVCY